MKRIIQFFAVCLAVSVLQTGFVCAATNKRDASVSSAGRTSVTTTKTTKSDSARTTTKTVKSVKQNEPEKKVVSARDATIKTSLKQRDNNTTKSVAARTATTNVARSAKSTKTTTARTAATRTPTSARSVSRSRAAELNSEKISAIKSKDYSKCKTVYYECMDEFCANKDANLRRCACSSRVHEFDNIKKQLSDAEDKMLDFNQRLLTVNLDKEDAMAINVATEGELAFAKQDTSESEKLLQKITKALNSSGDSKINNDLASISLSLDMDSAWDSVDSLSGIATTSKNGLDLYNAATPVCIEMAREVCSDEELEIAQNGYKLTIQQDCNTVAKSYDSQYNNAINKIHESSALLDMARLNNYQQRNSDDVLTCRKKILEQLSSESVCGSGLYKCLDTTGQYINPSTGAAFLSENLYDLTGLLTVPTGDETWAKLAQNDKFVSFLNSKKKFLTPAIEQCEDASDAVWQDFIEDALAQIKLAQNSKIEEIRQSCTTLVAECKIRNQTSLEDFDARALSTFSVIADTTVNALCTEVETSCVALLNKDGFGGSEWESGMTGLALDISYDKIIETCTTVGQDCIIRQCTGTSGNFALCQDFASNPRHAILNRTACWQEVLDCVNQSANIDNISVTANTYNSNTVFSICSDSSSKACKLAEKIWGNCEYDPITSLTTKQGTSGQSQNKILEPKNGSSLLSWFATNTGTLNNSDSCNASPCPVNYTQVSDGSCSLLISMVTTDGQEIHTESEKIDVAKNITNYCKQKDYWGNCCNNNADDNNNHVYTDITGKDICVPTNQYRALPVQDAYCTAYEDFDCEQSSIYSTYIEGCTGTVSDKTACAKDKCQNNRTIKKIEHSYYCGKFNNRMLTAYCFTKTGSATFGSGYVTCDGFWVIIDNYGNYFEPFTDPGNGGRFPPTVYGAVSMGYKYAPDSGSGDDTIMNMCTYRFSPTNSVWEWGWHNQNCAVSDTPTTESFIIRFNANKI